MEEKKCPGCNKIYPYTSEYFNYRSRSEGTLQSRCKICTRKATRKSRIKNGRERLLVEISPKEKNMIQENAEKIGLDVSKYMRHIAITKQPIIIKDIANLEEVETKIGNLEYEIRKLGNNVNQIAKVLNEGNAVPASTINSLLSVLERLDSRIEKINNVLAKSYDEIYK